MEAVRRILERWDAGDIARWQLQNELVALLEHDTIDAVVEALPDEHRAALLSYFDSLGPQHEGGEDLISIHGGTVYTRERNPWGWTDEEWDRIEREEQQREARERAHFRNVTLPAILDWRARHAR